jgi:hypothetical protein
MEKARTEKNVNIFVKPAVLAAAVLFVILSAAVSEGREFRVRPSITVGEEYNDNIFLTGQKQRTEDYITRFQPSLGLMYEAPLWRWDVNYIFEYLYYAKQSRDADTVHDLDAKGHIEAIKDFFYLDLSDRYQRVSLDVAENFAKQSPFFNQTNSNVFTASPYFVLRHQARLSLTIGYVYANTWYKEEDAVDKVENSGYLDASFRLSPKTALIAGYRFTRVDSDLLDFDRHEVHVGATHEYAEGSRIYFRVGNSWVDFDQVDIGYSRIFWRAGIVHEFRHGQNRERRGRLAVTVETARDYVEDPRGNPTRVDSYLLSLSKKLERTSLGISSFLREYRDIETRVLDTTSYGGTFNAKYGLTELVTGILDVSFEKFERKLLNSYTRLILTDFRIDYKAAEHLTLALVYRYTDSYSPDIAGDKYRNNRLMAEIRKDL